MDIKIQLCEICHTPLVLPDCTKRHKNGVVIKMGHSVGGWGSRQRPLEFSGEVCDECFNKYIAIMNAIKLWIGDHHSSPEITINEVRKKNPEWDRDVSDRRNRNSGGIKRLLVEWIEGLL
jgi:hypothetical protein